MQRSQKISVYLQDHYPPDKKSALVYPTAENKWNYWFNTWLNYLSPETLGERECELSLVLTDDQEIRRLNQQYRQTDQPTDVLAFPAAISKTPGFQPTDEPLYLGDIIISLDTALKQSQERGHSLEYEIIWLSCHGFLHLLGWDHPDSASLAKMLDMQAKLLQQIGLEIPAKH